MKLIPIDLIRELHQANISRTGGTPGVLHDEQLSSLHDLLLMYIGYERPSLVEIGAWYLQKLVLNHYFIDGNKRVGLATCLVFFELNGIRLHEGIDASLYDLTIEVAMGKITDVHDIAEWLDGLRA